MSKNALNLPAASATRPMGELVFAPSWGRREGTQAVGAAASASHPIIENDLAYAVDVFQLDHRANPIQWGYL